MIILKKIKDLGSDPPGSARKGQNIRTSRQLSGLLRVPSALPGRVASAGQDELYGELVPPMGVRFNRRNGVKHLFKALSGLAFFGIPVAVRFVKELGAKAV